jgi:clorobiocin biosynthesis protein CloN3
VVLDQNRCNEPPSALVDKAASHTGPGTGSATWQDLADRGILGACIPRRYGGRGFGAAQTSAELEKVSYECPNTGLIFGAAAHLLACAVPIRDLASEATRRLLLPGLCHGDLIAANAITEDQAGSDISRLQTTATPSDGGYVLRGVKSFATNAPIADLFVTYATTDPSAGYLGLSGFVVTATAPGIAVSELNKMGLHGCRAGRVEFHDVFVPADRLLGSPGAGGQVFQHSMTWERSCLFGLYLGCMRRLIERCVGQARDRHQWGRRIADFQAVSHRIAEMQRRFLAARHLLYAACRSIDEGEFDETLISSSKITTSEAAVATALDAIQIFGGSGYLVETAIEEELRNAIPAGIFSGTNEIHREIIAKGLGM